MSKNLQELPGFAMTVVGSDPVGVRLDHNGGLNGVMVRSADAGVEKRPMIAKLVVKAGWSKK